MEPSRDDERGVVTGRSNEVWNRRPTHTEDRVRTVSLERTLRKARKGIEIAHRGRSAQGSLAPLFHMEVQ